MTAACAQLVAVHPASASDESAPELNTVLFGSLDASRTGYASAGFKRTWQGSLDRSGLVTLATVGYGGSPERVDTHGEENAFRHKASASALLGYQWISGPVVLAGYLGPELDYERDPDFTGQAARPRFGLRAQGELWAHPTPQTLLTSTVIAGTARGHLWSRVSGGYAVWDKVFVGPEVIHYRTDDYREWRAGLHATGLSLGRFTLRLSGGIAVFDERTGGYVGLSGYIRM